MAILKFRIGNTRIKIQKGDITQMETDAIVNAANSSLMGGGGVDGAIHREGGPSILEVCKKIRSRDWPRGLPAGKAIITPAGDLKAKYVIHAIGPVWHGGNHGEERLLTEVYISSLEIAITKGLRSIAFPSISTGAYNYPIQKASWTALKAVKTFLEKRDNLDEVVFVLFNDYDLNIYIKRAKWVFQILNKEIRDKNS